MSSEEVPIQLSEEIQGQAAEPAGAVPEQVPEPEACEGPVPPSQPGVQELADLLRARDQTIAELHEQIRRVAADFENFRRRQEEEQKRRLQFMKEDLFRQLLATLDGLDRAIASLGNASVESLGKGVELLAADFRKLLLSHGVEPISVEGATFDPNHHEAMMLEERSDVPDQSILQEFQRGYRLGERVLRPSLVKVASNPSVTVENPSA